MNYSSMTEEEIAKLTAIEKKQPIWQQLQALTDIADISQELLNVADSAKKESKAQIQALGAVLTDAREQLVELNKKEAPEAPDYSKPVVDAVAKIEAAINKLDLKPKITLPAPIVDLKSPDVNVAAPDVRIDLKPLEKLLKVDIPKAFKESIALIPTPEKDDNSAILESLAEINDWLKSIDTVARKKPMLGTTAATGGGGGGSGTEYADGAARGTATGTLAMVDDGTNIQSLSGDSTGKLNVNNISGTVSLPTGAATEATLALIKAKTDNLDVALSTRAVTGLTDAQLRATPVTVKTDQTTHGTTDLVAADLTKVNGVAVNMGTGTASTGTQRVAVASDSSIVATQTTGTNLHTVVDSGTITTITNAPPDQTTTTSTQTSVANSVTSVTLLASNTARKSATIYNDDTAANLYVKFGTTASTTSFKIKIAAGGYYEFPLPIYTGRVDAIASAATGSARICEET